MNEPPPSKPPLPDFQHPAAVPRRFSIGTLLIVTAACALLFGILKALGANAVIGGFALAFFVCIAVAQMVFDKVPRGVSAVIGAVLLSCATIRTQRGSGVGSALIVFLQAAPFGAILGYVGGALVSGVFLLSDLVLGTRRNEHQQTPPPEVVPRSLPPPILDPPQRTPPAHVPRRFSIASLLMVTTACALLFGILKALGANAETSIFALTFFVAIAVAQMAFGKAPLLASAVTGAILFPVAWLVVIILSPSSVQPFFFLPIRYISIPIFRIGDVIGGALVGYVGGVLVAGLFLVQERITVALRRWREPH